MFLKVVSRLLRGTTHSAQPTDDAQALCDHGFALMIKGEKREAIEVFRACLARYPYHVPALVDLGACLHETGDERAAETSFELAYSLDDTFLPAAINRGKTLVDKRRGQEALPLLRRAKLNDPRSSHVDGIYGTLSLNLGEVATACQFHKRAWLGNFDSLGLANGHLFTRAYLDGDEREIAIEHQFWAQTCRPFVAPPDTPALGDGRDLAIHGGQRQRIRIGYWSPDFRSHSVRYFFRPLLENHDASGVEVFLYHDLPYGDEQTALIKAQVDEDHFHDVSGLSDARLFKLIRSHDLDILVELAGHSSHNRLAMLNQRFARRQLTGFGYPPTTGLPCLDGKLLDPHLLTPNHRRYYTEPPLVLASSFWCFDPLESVPAPQPPPVLTKGRITFGCVGNVGKISDRLIACWRQILDGVSGSALLLRSINFEDPMAMDAVRTRLLAAGIGEERFTMHPPAGGVQFFESYHEIDVVLDTFPFNGGTTTCFAAYMGVPVVTWSGESLLSRMGRSVMSNLGEPGLVAQDAEGYVQTAIRTARDLPFLERFRREARARFRACSLGNGALFARDFESACRELLALPVADGSRTVSDVPALPAEELMRRAYAVLRQGQADAAGRILAHCLAYHPVCGSAHVLLAQQMADTQGYAAARDHLLARMPSFSMQHQVEAGLCLVRLHLLHGQEDAARTALKALEQLEVNDPVDALQRSLYQSLFRSRENGRRRRAAAPPRQPRTLVVVPCDDAAHFAAMQAQVKSICRSAGTPLTFHRCDVRDRVAEYRAAMAAVGHDLVVLMHKSIEVHRGDLFERLAAALDDCDVVGFSGADRLVRIDWPVDGFEHKASGHVVRSEAPTQGLELRWHGLGRQAMVAHMAVLNGSMLALAPARMRDIPWDDALIDAGLLLEEEWTHAAYRAGRRLGVHRNLGIVVNLSSTIHDHDRVDALSHLADKHGIDPFRIVQDDPMAVSVPVSTPDEAFKAMDLFVEDQ